MDTHSSMLCSLLIHSSQTSSSMLCSLLIILLELPSTPRTLNHRHDANPCSDQRRGLKPDVLLQCPCLYFKGTEPSSWNIWKFNNSSKTNPDHALSSWVWLLLLWSSTCSKVAFVIIFFSFWASNILLELSSTSYPIQVHTLHTINSQKILTCKLVVSRYHTACTAYRKWLVFSFSSIY